MGRNDNIDLTPRGTAVLCALRQGPLTTIQLKNRIGDGNAEDTHDLLCDMITWLVDHRPGDRSLWYLTHDGVGWLESNGLPVAQESRLWRAQEALSLIHISE